MTIYGSKLSPAIVTPCSFLSPHRAYSWVSTMKLTFQILVDPSLITSFYKLFQTLSMYIVYIYNTALLSRPATKGLLSTHQPTLHILRNPQSCPSQPSNVQPARGPRSGLPRVPRVRQRSLLVCRSAGLPAHGPALPTLLFGFVAHSLAASEPCALLPSTRIRLAPWVGSVCANTTGRAVAVFVCVRVCVLDRKPYI
jgi:hypothetical protein